jgi:hypothetical protein
LAGIELRNVHEQKVATTSFGKKITSEDGDFFRILYVLLCMTSQPIVLW